MRVIILLAHILTASAWLANKAPANVANTPIVSRQDALKTMGGLLTAVAGVSFAGLPASAETLPSGVTYEVIKSGDGPKPEVGELVAIRFAAFAGSNKIDDIFDTPEPYYTRMGSGGLLKGVETTLPLMRLGDRWKLTIPVSLRYVHSGAVRCFCSRFWISTSTLLR